MRSGAKFGMWSTCDQKLVRNFHAPLGPTGQMRCESRQCQSDRVLWGFPSTVALQVCRVLQMRWNLSKFPHVPSSNVANSRSSWFLGINSIQSLLERDLFLDASSWKLTMFSNQHFDSLVLHSDQNERNDVHIVSAQQNSSPRLLASHDNPWRLSAS